ncbi:MAG: hypothetical protein RLZZ94_843 [Bacteroidota bacterium]|jgi:hypothetical protein
MSNRRRVIIIVTSVFIGCILSFLVFKLRRGGGDLTQQDQGFLITNFTFSLAIILGVGYFFIWNKKKDL